MFFTATIKMFLVKKYIESLDSTVTKTCLISFFLYFYICFSGIVVQRLEHRPVKPEVAGSNPVNLAFFK